MPCTRWLDHTPSLHPGKLTWLTFHGQLSIAPTCPGDKGLSRAFLQSWHHNSTGDIILGGHSGVKPWSALHDFVAEFDKGAVHQVFLVGGWAYPSEKWWSESQVGMMTFPIEWKNKIHVPNPQPVIFLRAQFTSLIWKYYWWNQIINPYRIPTGSLAEFSNLILWEWHLNCEIWLKHYPALKKPNIFGDFLSGPARFTPRKTKSLQTGKATFFGT